jgi:hypothetical protein
MKMKLVGMLAFTGLIAQFALAQTPNLHPKVDLRLGITSNEGNNGLAVAYNPSKNLYYTVYAGNAIFTMEVHKSTGESIKVMPIGGDLRGLWYNESKARLEGILFENAGTCSFELDGNGFPSSISTKSFDYGMGAQDVAVYNKGKVYFADYSGVTSFKQDKGKGKLRKHVDLERYTAINSGGFIHTGVIGYEFGFFDYEENVLMLVSAKTMRITAKVTISIQEEIESLENFRISYCNRRLFIYNGYSREWIGYKIF